MNIQEPTPRSGKVFASSRANHGVDFDLKNGRIQLHIKTRVWDQEHVEVHDVTDKLKPIFDKLNNVPLTIGKSIPIEDMPHVWFDEPHIWLDEYNKTKEKAKIPDVMFESRKLDINDLREVAKQFGEIEIGKHRFGAIPANELEQGMVMMTGKSVQQVIDEIYKTESKK